ncbi:Inositol-1-monophosphatase [Fulvivirga imtechensis AK7]|uniref:Inositol-1-monophosphatase n=1 Tax=Fulvivirga imtechensis AK7 TaxID=1237149 RepID=L8JX20_9BACT|nr:inositol monophosphatase family protein [Fulvivirga imtechensis]ELR72179.1 Inositol-1-monophosphatase [Fulvivirga imtechensis AK7]
MRDLDPVLKSVKTLTQEVGDFIRSESKNFKTSDIEHKGFNDLVSYVDKEAERKLVDGCRQIVPEAGFITEEGTASTQQGEYNWIIDPLDGTTNFTHGLPVYAISLALTFHNHVVLGVIYEINRDECFYATKGGSAYCNGELIKVSEVNELGNSLLATGFPYHDFGKMSTYLNILDSFMQQTHGLRRLGSAAVDLAYTACGRFEGFFEYNLKPWDVAAGIIIVQEAGGFVTDFSGGNNFLFGGEIVAAGNVHKDMLKVINGLWNGNPDQVAVGKSSRQ